MNSRASASTFVVNTPDTARYLPFEGKKHTLGCGATHSVEKSLSEMDMKLCLGLLSVV